MLLLGCGANNAGSVVRPKDATASETLGDKSRAAGVTCSASDDDRTLIVDAPTEDRKAIEEMLKRKRVPIVKYDCKSLVLLERCKLDSDFVYTGTALRDRVVRVESADEAVANLPLSSAQLKASVASGQKVDLALAEVGSKLSDYELLTRPQLGSNRPQDCEGATHFIHKVDVGAFALSQRSTGEVSSAAQIWMASAGGSSTSDRSSARTEGRLESCRKASDSDATAPDSCGVPLRVHLRRIEAPAPVKSALPIVAAPCEGSLVRSEGGVCIQPLPTVRHVCRGDDVDECAAQCQRGNVESCVKQSHFSLYGLPSRGTPVPKDLAKARALVSKTCVMPDPKGCVELMASYDEWNGDKPPSDANVTKGLEALAIGCGANDLLSCSTLGGNLLMPRLANDKYVDAGRGVTVSDRACRLGAAGACYDLGVKLVHGIEHEGKSIVAKDVPRGMALLERGCQLKDEKVCAALAGYKRNQNNGAAAKTPPTKPKK